MNDKSSDGTTEAAAAVAHVMELREDQRQDYLEMLGHAATIYMRLLGGDDYVRGWLEAAISELDHPPLFELSRPQ